MTALGSSVRTLLRRPGFTATAIITLALGIGLNVATFSAIYGVLLRPLPYPHPDRLAMVWARWTTAGVPRVGHPGGDYRELQRQTQTFAGLAALGAVRQTLSGSDAADQVQVGWVSRNFFAVLDVKPSLGRDFTAGEGPSSLILGNELWRRSFAGDPGVLGRTVLLDGQPFVVIGVLPAGFKLLLPPGSGIPAAIDAWKPPDESRAPERWVTSNLELASVRIVGRLKPGVGLPAAHSELDGIAAHLRAKFPDHAAAGFQLYPVPLQEDVVRNVRPVLLALQGAVGFVLLIACVNVANLLLVRLRRRERDLVLRLCLGSGMARIMRQLMLECTLLAAAGCLLGIWLAQMAIALLHALAPANVPRLDSVSIDGPVLAFAVGVTGVAILLAGLLPILRLRRFDLMRAVGGLGPNLARRESRLDQLLIAAEVALSLVLLVGAGLMARSFMRLQEVRPGFEPRHLLTFAISLPGFHYQAPVGTNQILDRLEQRITQLPGVVATGAVWPLPLEGQIWYGPYRIPDQPLAGNTPPLCDYRVIDGSYPKTVGARILEGRGFADADRNVVLIDQQLAARNWPGRSAIGRTILATLLGFPLPLRILGVVENVRHQDLRSDGRETLYLPARQFSRTDQEVFVVVRTVGDPQALAAPIRGELHRLDPQIPMSKVRPMESYVADALAANRLALSLMLIFSAAAVVLAAVGLYGVVSHSLSRRTREIGVRMALGAQRGKIFWGAIRDGFLPALLGIVVGGAAALVLERFLASLVFGISPVDPLAYGGTAALLAAVVLAACCPPAWHAVRLAPTIAIREL
jgi:putative ABC transport system permease protein